MCLPVTVASKLGSRVSQNHQKTTHIFDYYNLI